MTRDERWLSFRKDRIGETCDAFSPLSPSNEAHRIVDDRMRRNAFEVQKLKRGAEQRRAWSNRRR